MALLYLDVPLYTTTLGVPSDDFTLEKTWATEPGSDRSAVILVTSDELASSLALLDADATLYPFATKAFVTDCPTLAPEPRIRTTLGIEAMVSDSSVQIVV